jgi:DNA/RNA endonuclease YhcR with UshA esterase domain
MSFKRYVAAPLLALGLAAAGCDSDPVPVFEPQGTGTLEGFVFFDVDRDGIFDPAAGDFALPNVRVGLHERGTSQTLANGTAQSGADGRFVISNVRPGTHSLRVDTASIPAGTRFCQNPVDVSIRIGERNFRPLGGSAACIITIAEAEQTRGETVVIQGIVTSSTNQLRATNDYTYIQDETGGIRIFSTALANRGIEVGDRIEVTGVISLFSNDLQLAGTVTLGTIQKNVFQITPQDVTTGAMQAALTETGPDHPLLGTLVRIRAAEIVSAFGGGGINGRNVRINSGDGPAQMRIETGVVAGETAAVQAQMTAQLPVGRCYDITGVVGAFAADAQIFPRTLSDIVEVPCN